MAKIAKDIAAGAVLIAALNAVAVGYLVFSGEVATLRDPLHRLFDPDRAKELAAAVEVLGEWVAQNAAGDAEDAAEQDLEEIEARIDSLQQRYAGLADFVSLARARMRATDS